MKKLIIFVLMGILIQLAPANAQAINFNILMEKPTFLRYEIVSFKVNLTQDGNPVTYSSATLIARFYNTTGSLVTTVGSMQSVSMYYNSTDKFWYGFWPIQWDPDLGTYTINITANVSGTLYTQTKTFIIAMKQPKETLPQGFFAMTAEDVSGHMQFNIPGPYGESSTWLNMYKWAEFMGADAVWPTEGYITGYLYGQANQSFPWYYPSYQDFKEVCQAANESGFRCEPWIWPYGVFEPNGLGQYGITFDWALIYDCNTGNVVNDTGSISLLDERAINHTVKMIKILSTSPYINSIGIDWEPNWLDDLRLANDEFVRKMNVSVPNNWNTFTQEEKMKWIGSRISWGGSCTHDHSMWEKWHRWMVYNYAKTLKRIIDESNFSKSFFMYDGLWDPWGANVGRILNYNDAGIDIIAPMTYSSPARAKRPATGEWDNGCWFESGINAFNNQITSEKLPNVVSGQMIEGKYLNTGDSCYGCAYVNCSYKVTKYYPYPEEMYDRMMMTGEMYKDSKIGGLFWHDIWRANGNIVKGWHNMNLPYSTLEWAIAGGAAASDLRIEAGRIPINMSIEVPTEVYYGDTVNGNVTVTNLGGSSISVTTFLINNTPGWEFLSSFYNTVSLSPYQTRKFSFTIKSNTRDYDVDNRFMIAAKADWGTKSEETHLEFKYIHALPKSVFSGRLKDKNNKPVQANVIIYQEGTNNIVFSNQTDDGNYYMFIPAGTYDVQFNLTNFFIPDYSIKIKSVNMNFDFYDPIKYINTTKNTVSINFDVEENENIQIYSTIKPTRILKNGTVLKNVTFSDLDINKWFYNETENKICLTINRFLIGSAPLFGYYYIEDGGIGYNSYIYTAGPYKVNDTSTISSIYLYTAVSGKAKVALYSSVPTGSGYPEGWSNPKDLIVASEEKSCSANSWCYFDIQETTISPGDYFLAIKIDTNFMLTGIPRTWFGQFRVDDYTKSFPNSFGQVGNIGGIGDEISIYACCS